MGVMGCEGCQSHDTLQEPQQWPQHALWVVRRPGLLVCGAPFASKVAGCDILSQEYKSVLQWGNNAALTPTCDIRHEHAGRSSNAVSSWCCHLGLLCLADFRQGHLQQGFVVHTVQQAAAVDLNLTPVAACSQTQQQQPGTHMPCIVSRSAAAPQGTHCWPYAQHDCMGSSTRGLFTASAVIVHHHGTKHRHSTLCMCAVRGPPAMASSCVVTSWPRLPEQNEATGSWSCKQHTYTPLEFWILHYI